MQSFRTYYTSLRRQLIICTYSGLKTDVVSFWPVLKAAHKIIMILNLVKTLRRGLIDMVQILFSEIRRDLPIIERFISRNHSMRGTVTHLLYWLHYSNTRILYFRRAFEFTQCIFEWKMTFSILSIWIGYRKKNR